MEAQIKEFSVWSTIIHFIEILANLLNIFNPFAKYVEDVSWASWTSAENSEESEVEDDDGGSVSRKNSKTVTLTSEREDEEIKIALPVHGDEKRCIFHRDTESSSSKRKDEEAESGLSFSKGEGNAASIENSEGTCRKSEQQNEEETREKLPPSAVEDKVNAENKNPERNCFASEVKSDQLDGDINRKVTIFEDKGDTGVGPFMLNLFEKQLFTDVTFSQRGSKASISAHRAVLAAKCDFFQNLLFGDQRNEAVGMQMRVEVGNTPFSVFTSIVRYFYTGCIEFSDDYTVLEIYAAAQSFDIQPLVDQCKIYIDSIEVNDGNVFSTLQACHGKCVEGLKNRCLNYIQENTFRVLSSGDFEKCSFNTVREVCDLQNLNLSSEVELLEAVVRWVDSRPTCVKKVTMNSFLKCIRFLSFTPEEFGDVLQRHADLTTPQDGLKILIYLSNPTPENLESLPKWCNKIQRSLVVRRAGIRKETPQPLGGRIQILLKPTDEHKDVKEVTSTLRLNCIKGMHHIKSIKFFFGGSMGDENPLADLEIKVYVTPRGPSFLKTHSVNSSESSFAFSHSVPVAGGQVVKMVVTAKLGPSCTVLRFLKWRGDSRGNFMCYFTSKPKGSKLNFISEIEYEPIAPRLDAVHDLDRELFKH